MIAYHATKRDREFDTLEPGRDGGIHFGSQSQAQMRGSGKLFKAELDLGRSKRAIDKGDGWKGVIARAKRNGYDSIVYLNRFEGIKTETLQPLLALGWTSEKFDRLSDARFKALFPEAEDSYVVFSTRQAKPLND